MSNDFSLSTQFEINEIEIDDNDVVGLFQSVSMYENLSSAVITGSIVLFWILMVPVSSKIKRLKVMRSLDLSSQIQTKSLLSLKVNLMVREEQGSGHIKGNVYLDFTSEQVRKNEGIGGLLVALEMRILERCEEDGSPHRW